MQAPAFLGTRRVAADTELLCSYLPVPGFGVLPVNAYLLHARQPMLIDTGPAMLGAAFRDALWRLVAPGDLRWIWMTHMDADHLGSLREILDAAPEARVVTNFVGMAKMGLIDLPLDRVYLLNPGQRLDLGDRHVRALAPPVFDAPETTAAYDESTGVLFSSDCFGALMPEPAEAAADIPPEDLRAGMVTWATIDAPWLAGTDAAAFDRSLARVGDLRPQAVLSAHLPPATGMTAVMLDNLRTALSAPAFVGPDQKALEAAMAAA